MFTCLIVLCKETLLISSNTIYGLFKFECILYNFYGCSRRCRLLFFRNSKCILQLYDWNIQTMYWYVLLTTSITNVKKIDFNL